MRVLCSDIRDFKVWWYSNSLKTFNVSIILEEKIRRPYELHPHGLSAWRVLGKNEKHREREDPGLKNNPSSIRSKYFRKDKRYKEQGREIGPNCTGNGRGSKVRIY
jgi:hypothetical protein